MSNIRYVEGQIDLFWNQVREQFPGFDKPMIFSAMAINKRAPMYMRRYLDQDPDSFYIFLKGDPSRHEDITRQKAMEFFDRLFYEHLRMPSSYDSKSGFSPTAENPEFGTMTREQAISKEVLPASNDANYRRYYDEQMTKAGSAPSDDEFEQKMGFRRDDPSIIDISDTSPRTMSTSVGSATGTAVGMPAPIFYAVDMHVPASGMQLNYDGGGHLGNRRQGGTRRLRESGDAEKEKKELLKKLMGMFKKGDPAWNALKDVEEKFLSENDMLRGRKHNAHIDEGAPFTQDDADEIAGMFAGYSGRTSDSRDRMLAKFMQDHATELRRIARGTPNGLGDINAIRDVSVDDEQVNEGAVGILRRDNKTNPDFGDPEYDAELDMSPDVMRADDEDRMQTLKMSCPPIDDEDDEDDDETFAESMISRWNYLGAE